MAKTAFTSPCGTITVTSHVGKAWAVRVGEAIMQHKMNMKIPAKYTIDAYLGGSESRSMGCWARGSANGAHRANSWINPTGSRIGIDATDLRTWNEKSRALKGLQGQFSRDCVSGRMARIMRRVESTVAHEMVHAMQTASGRMTSRWDREIRSTTTTFEGSWTSKTGETWNFSKNDYVRKDTEYYDRPWEMEAFGTQDMFAEMARNPKPIKFTQASKKFACEHCGKEYGSRQGRYNHIRSNACGHQA